MRLKVKSRQEDERLKVEKTPLGASLLQSRKEDGLWLWLVQLYSVNCSLYATLKKVSCMSTFKFSYLKQHHEAPSDIFPTAAAAQKRGSFPLQNILKQHSNKEENLPNFSIWPEWGHLTLRNMVYILINGLHLSSSDGWLFGSLLESFGVSLLLFYHLTVPSALKAKQSNFCFSSLSLLVKSYNTLLTFAKLPFISKRLLAKYFFTEFVLVQ